MFLPLPSSCAFFLFAILFPQLFLKHKRINPAKRPFAQTPPRMLLPPSPQPQPSPTYRTGDGHFGSITWAKLKVQHCQRQPAKSPGDIHIVIPQLITLSKFSGGNREAGWSKNRGIYDSQHSRLMHFLITGKYIGIACRVGQFKAQTNSKDACWERSMQKKVHESIVHLSSTVHHRNLLLSSRLF